MGLRDFLTPKPRPDPGLRRIENKVDELAAAVLCLGRDMEQTACQAVERHNELMATIQEFRDALNEQNQAILAEIEQINQALAAAGNVPQDLLDQVKAHTQAVKGIIADPLPPVDPNPPPPPERRR